MKKLILFIAFISFQINAQVKDSDYCQKTIITGKIEIDGHEVNQVFILETNLYGIKIYEKKTEKEYKFRKCEKENCKIIHLELKQNSGVLNFNKQPFLLDN